MNQKRFRRLYREEGLAVRERKGRKRALGMRAPVGLPSGPNERWSLTVAGRYSDRNGATRVLSTGVAAFGLAYLGFTRDTGDWAMLFPWFVLAGIGIGCVETAEHAAIATHAPVDIRGSAFGLLAATQSLGNLAASTVAGILWSALSPTWAFGYLATAMVIAFIALQLGDHRTVHTTTGS